MRACIVSLFVCAALAATCEEVALSDRDALLKHCDSVRDGKLSVNELSQCVTKAIWGGELQTCVTPSAALVAAAQVTNQCVVLPAGTCEKSDYDRVPTAASLVKTYDSNGNGFIEGSELSGLSARVLLATLTTRKGSVHDLKYDVLRDLLRTTTADPTVPMSIRMESVTRLWQRFSITPTSTGGGVVLAAGAGVAAAAAEDSHDGHDHRRSWFPAPGTRRKALSNFVRGLVGAEPDLKVAHGGALRQATAATGGVCLTAPAAFAAADTDNNGAISALELPLLQSELLRCLVPSGAAAAGGDEEEDCDEPSVGEAWLATMVATVIITLIALVGLIVVPVGRWLHVVLRPLVMFAVGALLGDVLLHIIPHTFPMDLKNGHSHSEPITEGLMIGRFVVILGSFWAFFLLDRTIRVLVGSAHAETAFQEHKANRSENHSALGGTMTTVPGGMPSIHGVSSGHVAAGKIPLAKSGSRLWNMFFGQVYDVRGDGKTPSFFRGEIAPVAYVNLISDAVHNFVDGVTIGVAFSTDYSLGFSTSLAIVFHELAQEFGDFAILLSAGMAKWQALLWNVLSGVIAIAGGCLGVILGQSGDDVRIWVLLIAAGAFIYIAATSMLSETLSPPKGVGKPGLKNLLAWRYIRDLFIDTAGFALGVAAMYVLRFAENEEC